MPKNQGRKKKFSIKKIAYCLTGVVAIVVAIALIGGIEKKESNTVLTSNSKNYPLPRQYSDQNITPQAKIADKRFESIGFSPSIKKARQSDFASVMQSFQSFFSSREPIAKDERERGTWVWTPTIYLNDQYVNSIISNAKENEINTIYLSIDSYLDVFALSHDKSKAEEKKQLEQNFVKRLENFIAKASENGIKVDAEAGWRNWAENGHEYKPYIIVDFVKRYNESHPENQKFRGFQYDVEPYLLDYYEQNKAEVLERLVHLVEQTRDFIDDESLHYSVVIPEFYDGETPEYPTPKFSYNGKYGYAIDHLLSVLSERDNTSIIVMSYRNFAEGKNGSIDISKKEIETANRGRFKTNIILAQETGDVLPEYVTFFNTSKKHFDIEVEKMIAHFDDSPSFAGVAIHYANAFMELK